MIEWLVTKKGLHDRGAITDDLQYWLSKTPEERIFALERLWAQRQGPAKRLQRIARVVERLPGAGAFHYH